MGGCIQPEGGAWLTSESTIAVNDVPNAERKPTFTQGKAEDSALSVVTALNDLVCVLLECYPPTYFCSK